MTKHLSYYHLDQKALGLSGRDSRHLKGCEECQGYIKDAELNDAAVPVWAYELADRNQSWWPQHYVKWSFFLAPALALVLLMVFVLQASEPRLRPDILSKGGAEAQVFVRHDGEVVPWDEGLVLVPGDQLRLRFVGATQHRVGVYSENEGQESLLDQSTIPQSPFDYPKAWVVDDLGGDESLKIVFESPAGERWLQSFLFKKHVDHKGK